MPRRRRHSHRTFKRSQSWSKGNGLQDLQEEKELLAVGEQDIAVHKSSLPQHPLHLSSTSPRVSVKDNWRPPPSSRFLRGAPPRILSDARATSEDSSGDEEGSQTHSLSSVSSEPSSASTDTSVDLRSDEEDDESEDSLDLEPKTAASTQAGRPSPKKRSQSWTEGDCEPASAHPPITKMSSFQELAHMAQGKRLLIGIDLDETVIMTANAPSWLLTSFGVATFQAYVNRRYSDFFSRNRLCRDLEHALKKKILVQESIPSVIKKLQEDGHWIFGLTARYNEMGPGTIKTLAALGIDFSRRCPFAPDAQDARTKGWCCNGVVFCNGMKKGVVLSQLLNKLSPAFLTSNFLGQYSRARPGTSAPPEDRDSKRCQGVVFLDDSLQQLCSLREELVFPDQHHFPIHCFHFQAERLQDHEEQLHVGTSLGPEQLALVRGKVLMKQMSFFAEQNQVLSNQAAMDLIFES